MSNIMSDLLNIIGAMLIIIALTSLLSGCIGICFGKFAEKYFPLPKVIVCLNDGTILKNLLFYQTTDTDYRFKELSTNNELIIPREKVRMILHVNEYEKYKEKYEKLCKKQQKMKNDSRWNENIKKLKKKFHTKFIVKTHPSTFLLILLYALQFFL